MQASGPLLFRVFLKDGGALVSYGEFARVSDRVVLSVPLGEVTADPRLQLVTINESAVDWEKTEAYSFAVRARQYAETRGEDDYALLLGQVTNALNDLSVTADPVRRLAMAEEARRTLAAWPASNYGFKAQEVAKLVSMFDDAVAELKAAAGQGIELNLVALTVPPPIVEVMAPPDAATSFQMAYRAALLAADAAERTTLLRSISESLKQGSAGEAWAQDLQTRVDGALAVEVRADQAYADLMKRSLASATTRARRADVRGLQDVIGRVLASDDKLGRKRPAEIAALLATLDVKLDEARRLRLARDSWALRFQAINAYRQSIVTPLERLASFRRWLEAIRALAGPDPRFLKPLEDRAHLARLELSQVTPPADAQAAHQLLTAALHMTRHAAVLRRNAVSSNDSKTAWEASAAAAGALTLAERAIDELHRLISSRPSR